MDFITEFAIEYRRWIVFVHIAGAIISIGAVTMADLLLLLFKFNPRSLGTAVVRVAPILSLQVWIGLLLSSLSGILLLLPHQSAAQYNIFQFKMLLVLVVFLNGIFLNMWINPKFEELLPEWEQKTKHVKKFMLIAGLSTAISFSAWWGIIILMKVFY
ncbi:MAG: hypothetical protein WD712_00495 [Candidatus Spechtbacterales bacterium]